MILTYFGNLGKWGGKWEKNGDVIIFWKRK